MASFWRKAWRRSIDLLSGWRRIHWNRRWEFVDTLSRTRESEVWEVRCRRTGLRRVLKLVAPTAVQLRNGRWAEATCTLAMRHESIIRAWRQARVRDGRYLLELDYVEGDTLLSRLQRSGGLSEAAGVPILLRIGAALSYVHWSGWVHGDVCPHNILVDAKCGGGVLIDFGRAAEHGRGARVRLRNHSLAYAAPEERGRPHPPSIAAEIYSFGLLAVELLTGRLPEESQSGLPALPHRLGSLLSECLAPLPVDRPPNMQAVVQQLAAAHDATGT